MHLRTTVKEWKNKAQIKNHSFVFIFSGFKNIHSFCKDNGTFPLNKLKKSHFVSPALHPQSPKCNSLRLLSSTPDLNFGTALSQLWFLFHCYSSSLPSQQTVEDSRKFSPQALSALMKSWQGEEMGTSTVSILQLQEKKVKVKKRQSTFGKLEDNGKLTFLDEQGLMVKNEEQFFHIRKQWHMPRWILKLLWTKVTMCPLAFHC